MRNIKVGTIQPRLIAIPQPHDYNAEAYDNDPGAIMDSYVRKQLAVTAGLLHKAGAEGCGIVTTCEDAAGVAGYSIDVTEKNVFPELVAMSETLCETVFSEIAETYAMYVVGCYYAKRDGAIYNIAAVFDRKGRIVGEYRKTHLPANEKWQCAAGDSLDVFDLDFGRIGVSICYDIMFPESVRVLALKGAEILFHPTFGYGWYDAIGEATLRTRANDSGLYIVTSKNYIYNAAGKSSVIDYWGQVLADAGFDPDVVVTKEIDLDVKKEQPGWYFNTPITGTGEVSARLRLERRPELYAGLCGKEETLKIPGRAEQLRILKGIRAGRYHW